MDLEPLELGVALELDKWIQSGDEIELVVEGIGSLKNKVGQKESIKIGNKIWKILNHQGPFQNRP